MTNPTHLMHLQWGVAKWNDWREESPRIKPDLHDAYLFAAHLSSINLSQANLQNTDLFAADLFWADFSQADLRGANLSQADLSDADLSGANLANADLSSANLARADLSRAILTNANLSMANLSRANLTGADLTGADLTGVNLTATHVLSTNLTHATLTGAILEDWNINSATHLEGVNCDYVYVHLHPNGRRPNGGRFAPGEFTKLFQKALETVDLIFLNGIEWAAFLNSFQKLQVENDGSDISIQAIEKKNDGAFVIRVNVPPVLNKKTVESSLKQEYKRAVYKLNEQYRYQLKVKEEQIELYRQQNTNLLDVVKTLASQTINVQSVAIAENKTMSEVSKYDLKGANIGNFADTVQSGGLQQTIQHNLESNQQKSLPEVASEIQQLLMQLAQDAPNVPEANRPLMVKQAIAQKAKENPGFRKRLLSAAESGSLELAKAFSNNPYISVPIAVVKGWLKPA